ncbi:MAG TPA: mycothiol synthase [Streptosporangiaceae bacterium]
MSSASGAAAAGQVEVRVSGPLQPADAAEVLDLVGQAADADRVSPLSEHALLSVRSGQDPRARHVRLWDSGRLAGYGHLDPGNPADPAEGPAGEMVIRPSARRRGLGRALGRALVAEAGGRQLRVWAHGDLPAASALASAAGFRRSRALWQMHRPLARPLAEPQVPAGVSVRTFRVGQDEDAWLGVNRRAFARHPEQGSWQRADLELREREPWFDPAGFFLAERDGELAGFHWTKVHPGQAGSPSIGEVYVVGVDPAEQGTGLGRALTLIGLQYLRSRGLPAVMLYVDEANVAAIRLYETLGFAHSGTDVMFAGGGSADQRA